MAIREDLDQRPDGTVVVEAPSVEAALEAVERRFGPDATIVDAERLNTRGVGGFFSKQSYRVVVKADTEIGFPEVRDHVATPGPLVPEMDLDSDPASMSVSVSPNDPFDDIDSAAVDHVLEQIERFDAEDGRTFGEVLRAQLQNRPALDGSSMAPADVIIDLRETQVPTPSNVSAMPPDAGGEYPLRPGYVASDHEIIDKAASTFSPSERPGPLVAAPIGEARDLEFCAAERQPLAQPVDDCPDGTGRVMWSVDSLSRLGVPFRLISQLSDLDPGDELAWVYRLSEVASVLCGPLPDKGSVFVGRSAAGLADLLQVDVYSASDIPEFEGDIAVSGDPDADIASYAAKVSAGRGIHLVIDNGPLRIRGDIAAVSWTDDTLSEALHVALSTGATLGYRFDADGAVRITPFELALSIRALLPRE